MIRLIDFMLLNLMQPTVRGDRGLLDDMNAARERQRAAKRQLQSRTVSRFFK